jgi:hypothetical protein
MSWSVDNTAEGTYNNSDPDTVSITIAATAKLLVVTRWTNGITPPTGGSPTANSVTLTDSGQGFVAQAAGECGVQVWYLVNPPTGLVTVSIPNINTTFGEVVCSSYIPSAGACAYVNSVSTSGLTQNPSTTYSIGYNNCLLFGALASGDRDVPTAGTNYSLIATYDAGNQTWGTERWLDSGTSGTKTVSFGTARADDWGLIGVAFREATATSTSSSKHAYLKGRDSTSNNKSAYLKGKIIATPSSKSAFMKGGTPTTPSSKSGYLKGKDITLISKPAYTIGSIIATPSSKSGYLKGSQESISNKVSYLKGKDTGLSNKYGYVRGKLDTLSNKSGYLKGRQSITSSKSAFILGKDIIINSKSGYVHGQLLVSDSKLAYTEGKTGAQEALDNKSAYLVGLDYSLSNKSAYLSGSIDTSDNRFVYLSGISSNTDNKSSYTSGISSDINNKPAYLEGYLPVNASSISAFILGFGNPLYADGDSALVGTWRNQDNSPNNLYQSVDEAYPDDDDYVWNVSNDDVDYIEFTLSNPPSIPADGDVVILFRIKDNSNSVAFGCYAYLYQGSTQIAHSGYRPPYGYAYTFYFVLTPEQRANITDWNDLKIRIFMDLS